MVLLTLAKRTFRNACSACGCGVSNSHSETAFFASNLRSANPFATSISAMACAAFSALMAVMPHFARRFRIDPEIIEVNASFRGGARRLDHLAYSYVNDPYRGLHATLV